MTRWNHAFKLTPLAALLLASSAFATNGYFPHGYGIRAKGMGGASVAMTEDSMGGANNPAGMVWVGSRLDVGMDLFSPRRDATRSDAGFPTLNGSVDSQSKTFLVPEFGYNKMLGWNMSLGISVYGNGGMNTDYPGGQISAGAPGVVDTVCDGFNGTAVASGATSYNMLCGTGRLGIDLMQLVIAPTFADIFYNNCSKNGVLPIRLSEEQVEDLFQRANQHPGYKLHVDLHNCTVKDDFGLDLKFAIDDFRQHCMLNGLDDIALTLKHESKITAFENQMCSN